MARKSRKQVESEQLFEATAEEYALPKIPTALYGRLSVEDEPDHNSMNTQIALLQDFVDSRNDLDCREIYFDNGRTGTNFNRPEFTKLMDDIRKKKIKCVVVKDLSRFGRNYLETCYYIETIFPFLDVRLGIR